MALGEKLFEENGSVIGFNVTKVHPVEGMTMEVSFTSEVKGEGKFPAGKNMGSGSMTQYPNGMVDASYHGSFISNEGDQFMWRANEKSKVVDGGRIKGVTTVTGFTNSQELSWMNNTIFALETEYDPSSEKIKTTAYEWK
jgi:hypothetical protein